MNPLPSVLTDLETALEGVQSALAARDLAGLEQQAATVQRLMHEAAAVAREPGVTPEWRRRLARAGAVLAAQRQVLSRATASLDRAIDVIMPRETLGLYGQQGRSLRRSSSGAGLLA